LQEGGFDIVFDDTERLINTADGKTAMLLIPLLDDKYQDVLSLRFEEEKTITEIANLTGQTKNTVSVQIRRGIDKLAILFRAEHPTTIQE
jgi:RNA polymerase sigma factor (sigma-70 family)